MKTFCLSLRFCIATHCVIEKALGEAKGGHSKENIWLHSLDVNQKFSVQAKIALCMLVSLSLQPIVLDKALGEA